MVIGLLHWQLKNPVARAKATGVGFGFIHGRLLVCVSTYSFTQISYHKASIRVNNFEFHRRPPKTGFFAPN
jgi:hypothetical protein